MVNVWIDLPGIYRYVMIDSIDALKNLVKFMVKHHENPYTDMVVSYVYYSTILEAYFIIVIDQFNEDKYWAIRRAQLEKEKNELYGVSI